MKTRADEIRICGLASVKNRFRLRPETVKRLFFNETNAKNLAKECKYLAQHKKVYRCVDTPELEKVSGTVHHNGVVAVVESLPLAAPNERDLKKWALERQPVLLLDRIGNAHNLGAIARTAAFLGVSNLVIPNDPSAAIPGEAAFRVAEGGLEHLFLWRVDDLPTFARKLQRSGYEVIGAATRGGDLQMNGLKSPNPVAIVLGNEESGMSKQMEAACSRLVTINGIGCVESLNVSVAAAILMHCFLPTPKPRQ